MTEEYLREIERRVDRGSLGDGAGRVLIELVEALREAKAEVISLREAGRLLIRERDALLQRAEKAEVKVGGSQIYIASVQKAAEANALDRERWKARAEKAEGELAAAEQHVKILQQDREERRVPKGGDVVEVLRDGEWIRARVDCCPLVVMGKTMEGCRLSAGEDRWRWPQPSGLQQMAFRSPQLGDRVLYRSLDEGYLMADVIANADHFTPLLRVAFLQRDERLNAAHGTLSFQWLWPSEVPDGKE